MLFRGFSACLCSTRRRQSTRAPATRSQSVSTNADWTGFVVHERSCVVRTLDVARKKLRTVVRHALFDWAIFCVTVLNLVCPALRALVYGNFLPWGTEIHVVFPDGHVHDRAGGGVTLSLFI